MSKSVIARRGAPIAYCGYMLEIDMEHCSQCGGTSKIIAAIDHPPVIAKILTHLGLPAIAPPRPPARLFDRLRKA